MRIKKILKNLYSEIIPQIVLAILGIIKSRFFLIYLGENVVGLYQVFSQVLGYLSIVEGGLGNAVVYKMYRPMSEKNYEKIAEIRNGIIKIFSRLSIIIFVLGIGMGFAIPFLIKDNCFSVAYIVLNFLIYVISELVLYSTVFERAMFIATESTYKSNIILKGTLIIKSCLEIVLAMYIKNITIIFVMFVLVNAIGSIFIKMKARKEFNFIKPTNKVDLSILSQVKNLMVHKIAGLIASNVDVILLSSFMGLSTVVVYTTYNLFVTTLVGLLGKISNAFLGTIGNILIEDKEKAFRAFKEYNCFILFIAVIIGVPFFFCVDYFINIWYSGKVVTSSIIALFFSLLLIYNIIRIPLLTYTDAAGLYKETKICPIIESVINLTLSLILINFYGVAGILFATLLSLIVSEFLIKPNIIYKNIFNKSPIDYYADVIMFIVVIAFMLCGCIYLKNTIFINGLLSLCLIGAILFIFVIVITIVICILIKRDYFIVRLKGLIFKRK
ncbi:MAG: hypothetical protein RSE56_03285 [Bacilli bacterium]